VQKEKILFMIGDDAICKRGEAPCFFWKRNLWQEEKNREIWHQDFVRIFFGATNWSRWTDKKKEVRKKGV
jgi:hypothetical protein